MIANFRDPFEALFAIQRALDARRESDWLGGRTSAVGGFPPINLFQHGDDLVAIIELPGIERGDLQIEAKENTIRISGKKDIRYDERASMHRCERVWGAFDRNNLSSDPDRSGRDQSRISRRHSCAPYPAGRARQAAVDQDQLATSGGPPWQRTRNCRSSKNAK